MALLASKCHFWEGASKVVFTIFATPKLCSCENTIFVVFSAKHSFAETKECQSKKNRNLPIIGGCLPTCKRVFFLFVSLFFGVFFFVSFLFFLFEKP